MSAIGEFAAKVLSEFEDIRRRLASLEANVAGHECDIHLNVHRDFAAAAARERVEELEKAICAHRRRAQGDISGHLAEIRKRLDDHDQRLNALGRPIDIMSPGAERARQAERLLRIAEGRVYALETAIRRHRDWQHVSVIQADNELWKVLGDS